MTHDIKFMVTKYWAIKCDQLLVPPSKPKNLSSVWEMVYHGQLCGTMSCLQAINVYIRQHSHGQVLAWYMSGPIIPDSILPKTAVHPRDHIHWSLRV